MSATIEQLEKLRNIINENLRTQVNHDEVDYISSGHTVSDISSKQSHCIFARRGCGKTLLLHHSRKKLGNEIRAVYINCEDFKHHSFPNVLIQILDGVFSEIDANLHAWFGKKAKLRKIIRELREDLRSLTEAPDQRDYEIRDSRSDASESREKASAKINAPAQLGAEVGTEKLLRSGRDLEYKYRHNEDKLRELNHRLPGYKNKIREFFQLCTGTKAIFIQLDDFYHLNKIDQPFVADYVHRLCKDTALKFKIATLKHNSVLYIERKGQPIGIQERHDYQPINIDFTFEQFEKTRNQNKGIFHEYAKRAGLSASDFDELFKGQGFDRLVLAGGGVPRDVLSFFLDVLHTVRRDNESEKIGKDDVRFLSRQTFESRINELERVLNFEHRSRSGARVRRCPASPTRRMSATKNGASLART